METVRQYVCNPLASDSDDESRLNRAESRAVRKKKNQKSKSKARAPAAYGTLMPLISVCGVVWGHSQERFHNSSSYNLLGRDLVPFVDIQSQESTREASTLSVPVLPVERQTTSVETSHTPGVQHQSHNSPRYPPKSEAAPTGKSPDFDIEDEYSLLQFTEFDHDRFTENYFEYEQGQKDIIVKNRLKNHIAFWENIGAGQFIIDTILYGFKIPFYSLPPMSVSKNSMSAIRESVFCTRSNFRSS